MAPLATLDLAEQSCSVEWVGEHIFQLDALTTTGTRLFDCLNFERVVDLATTLLAQGSPSVAIAMTYHDKCFALHFPPDCVWVFDPHGNYKTQGPAIGCSTWARFNNAVDAVEFLRWTCPPLPDDQESQNDCQLVGYW